MIVEIARSIIRNSEIEFHEISPVNINFTDVQNDLQLCSLNKKFNMYADLYFVDFFSKN